MMSRRFYKQRLFWNGLIALVICGVFCINGYAKASLLLQQQQVWGQVTDSQSGEPLPGVNIVIKGTTTGTSTDANGEYELTVESLQDTLVFSYVGYQTNTVPIDGRSNIDLVLTPQAVEGEDLIVVGYGEQESRDITGSIASVSSEQLDQAISTNPVQALQGRVPGVNISQNSWNPGGSASIRIRGTRSITAGNDPLFVIDGNPISRSGVTLNDINPSEIESIEILKDASATAIYGSRGANGVILITTKRGERTGTSINYSSYFGYQEPLKEPRLWNAGEYVEYLRESFRNSETYDYPSEPSPEADAEIPQITQDPYQLESVMMGWDDEGNWHPDRVRGFDWLDAVKRTGYIQDQTLSISRNTPNSHVIVTGGYFNDVGMVKNMDFERYSLRANVDYNVSDRIKISSSTYLSRVNQDIGNDLYALSRTRSPIGRPFDDDGEWIFFVGNDPLMTNPMLDIEGVVSESQKNRFMTNMNVDIDLFGGLRYRGTFGYDYRTARDGEFRSSFSTARLGDPPTSAYGGNLTTDYLIENLLIYEAQFGDHEIEATVMNGYQDHKFESFRINVRDLPYETQLFYNVGSASEITGVNSGLNEWQMVSWMGRINYTLFDKYLFTLTGRSDGSSRLAPGNKYHLFPSGAVGWRISDETFMQGVDFVDDLKLRVSYGITGNSAIQPYTTQGSLNLHRYVWGEDLMIGYVPSGMPNRDLQWETTAQANIGLEFGFFENRISGSIDVYRANTSNLLMPRSIPVVSGFGSVLDNVGKTRNTGLEIALSTVNTSYENSFRWDTDLIFSTNKEEIVELVEGRQDDVGNEWFIGHPIDVEFGTEAVGMWQNTSEDLEEMAQFNENGHNYEPGYVKLRDLDGDYQITDADRHILGSSRPKWTGSITNNLYYKNFDFSFQIYASYGALGAYDQGLQLNGRYNQPAVDYWTQDNPSNRYPKPNYDWLGPDNIARTYIEDASLARLKFVTLGYTLPTDMLGRLKLRKLRVYLSAQNPYILTNFSGPDPEGAQYVTTPSPKTFMAGIDLSF